LRNEGIVVGSFLNLTYYSIRLAKFITYYHQTVELFVVLLYIVCGFGGVGASFF